MPDNAKPRRHYDATAGQMVWMPRRIYAWLRALAAAEHRTISRQLELIITEWLAGAFRPGGADDHRTAALREAAEEWIATRPEKGREQ